MEPSAVPVAEGVWRVTTPLPFRPRTVHAYLLDGGAGGWVLVDGGANTPEAWAALEAGMRAAGLEPRAIALHVVTHMHVDHVGLAARVRAAGGAPLAMGALDAERARHAATDPAEEARYRERLLRENGAPGEVVRALAGRRPGADPLSSFVPADHLVREGEAPLAGAPEWAAVWTPGHTAGHIALHRAADGLVVGGDAVLPRVTPTIGVNRQRADPVADYLGTLARLRALAPRLLLPGHGEPIARPAARLAELEDETRRELDRVHALLGATPATAWELAGARYAGRDLPPDPMVHALRETLAHLHHLVARGSARSAAERGVVRFWPS